MYQIQNLMLDIFFQLLRSPFFRFNINAKRLVVFVNISDNISEVICIFVSVD